LESEVTSVGRHRSADILLDDVTVSRRHVEVDRTGDRYVVRDIGSLNGTYLNGDRIESAELHDGDELQIGRFKLVFFYGTAT
jgi:pSer/pThr/pTyr-binding forkhead associated (FHA) protein